MIPKQCAGHDDQEGGFTEQVAKVEPWKLNCGWIL